MIDVKLNTIFPFKGKLYKIIRSSLFKNCNNCRGKDNRHLCNIIQCYNRKDCENIVIAEIRTYHETMDIDSCRKYSNTKVKAIESESDIKCLECSFYSVCAKNNHNSDFTFKVENYFGECDYSTREDNKSINFAIVENNNNNNNFNFVNPMKEFLVVKTVNIDKTCDKAELYLSKGRVIDEEHSDLSKGIICFKDKPYLFYEDILDSLDTHIVRYDGGNEVLQNIVKLLNIIQYYNLCSKYKETKRCTIRKCDGVYLKAFTDVPNNSPFVINYEEAADEIITNPEFRAILDKAL